MTAVFAVEIVAAVLAVWAAVLSLPRPPSLDWQRLLKVSLSTLIRGELEAADGTREDWEQHVAQWVPYHPAGRDPASKLLQPDPMGLPTPALAGERALTEALAALPDVSSRWTRMFADNEQTRDALLSDPDELGAEYSARAFFGAEADWDGVAAWSDGVVRGLQRRLAHIVVLSVGGTLGVEMATDVGLRGVHIAPDDPIAPHLKENSDRLLLVLEGDSALAMVKRLHQEPGLRDRVLMVLSIGAVLQGDEAATDWMTAHFTHEQMDTELNRQTAYAAVQLVTAQDVSADVDHAQRWPSPPVPASGRSVIASMDLGYLPPVWLTTPEHRRRLGRGLWVLAAAWLA